MSRRPPASLAARLSETNSQSQSMLKMGQGLRLAQSHQLYPKMCLLPSLSLLLEQHLVFETTWLCHPVPPFRGNRVTCQTSFLVQLPRRSLDCNSRLVETKNAFLPSLCTRLKKRLKKQWGGLWVARFGNGKYVRDDPSKQAYQRTEYGLQ